MKKSILTRGSAKELQGIKVALVMWMKLIAWLVQTFLKVRGRPEVPAAAIIWRVKKFIRNQQKKMPLAGQPHEVTIHIPK